MIQNKETLTFRMFFFNFYLLYSTIATFVQNKNTINMLIIMGILLEGNYKIYYYKSYLIRMSKQELDFI